MTTWLRGRKKDAVGRAVHIFLRAEHADVRLNFVVVRRNVFVGNRPIVAESIARLRTKIHRRKAQSYATPVTRSSAHNSRAEPLKIAARGGNVRFAFDLPRAIGREKLPEIFCGF